MRRAHPAIGRGACYRLSAPPRGQHWVRIDNDFLLVYIATGVISSVIATR